MLRSMTYGWSVALGTVHAVLMAWWLFAVTFPCESQDEPSKDDRLIAVAFAMFGCAVVVFVAL